MNKELQILEEKFKDIKARLGAAISIIDEAESVFSRVRLEAGKLSEEKASFVEFVKNELEPQLSPEKIKAKIFDYVESSWHVAGLEYVTIGEIVELCFDGGYSEDAILQYVSEMYSDKKLDYHKIDKNKASDYTVYLREADKKEKLTSDYILKYLTGKPNGATLKQIQSRFKGYSGNKCKEIAALVAGESGLQILFSGEHFSQSVVQIRKPKEELWVFFRVTSLLADVLTLNTSHDIESSTRIVEDLGADSLDIAEIVMAVEEEFNISVPDEDAEKVKTVGDIVEYINSVLR